MWYNIDFNKWAVLLLPIRLRKPKMIAFVKTLVAPLVNLHYRFNQYRTKDEFILNHNSQVCYLRKALNDKFDFEDRRITIVNGNQYKRTYIYTKAEQKPIFLGKLVLYQRSDYENTGVDYIVIIPTSLENLRIEIKALINRFNSATMRFKIVTQ